MNEPVLVKVAMRFSSTQEEAYSAWLSPTLVGQWMFGPLLREEEVLRISIEPRLGGSFSFLVNRCGTEIDHVGQYQELKPFERLVFTWGLKEHLPETSLVRVNIRSNAEGCDVELEHELDPVWKDYAARTEEAWTKMLAVLNQLLIERKE